ncbi:hypothetical protein DPMN_030813 [Dreissena polymorpha]|uniref:Uncharacterized protein n=1 Tax=Dreissena polymorpha TaxID=45954 RepID=A0A9D4M138_DREPO|nr:hypothetical protein DPMN_030813 [Dreissena polymorpha]
MKQVLVGSQYCSHKAGAKFCESIAKTTKGEVVKKILNCSWCSLSCDGTTEFTGEDMEFKSKMV